ncbi:MAG: hypothetical protein ABI673_09100 [Novosphingobium sp.]
MDRLNLGMAGGAAAGDFAAVLAWWREAGVDAAFSDETVGWLRPPEAEIDAPTAQSAALPRSAPAPAAPPRPRIGGDSASWPQDLASFNLWWLAEPSLDAGRTAGRVPPRGSKGAALMVLVEQPEAADTDILLSGTQGHFINAVMAAMGVDASEVYLASVLTRHTPMPDWAGLAADGLGAVTAHHLKLAAPARVIAFGSSILPLLGHDPAQNAANLHNFDQDGRTIPVLGAPGLDAMTRARAKSGLWQRWLDWTGNVPS